MIQIRRALGIHGPRYGGLSSHGKAAFNAIDPDKEALVGVVVNDGSRVVVEGIGRGGKTLLCKVEGKEIGKYRLHRARKGSLLPVKMKPAFIL